MTTNSLNGQTVVVTGAGRGVGREVAILLAKEGAQVVVNDPGVSLDGQGDSRAPADAVVNEIRKQGGQAVASYVSGATMAGGEAIVQSGLDAFGKLDGMVTCSGTIRDRLIFNMTEEEWDAVIAVHLKGTFSVVRAACQVFRKQQHGRIVNIASLSGLHGVSGRSGSAAAQEGILGLMRVVAKDMARYHVSANALCINDDGYSRGDHREEDGQRAASEGLNGTLTPTGSISSLGSAAAIAAWLLSGSAVAVTGQVLYAGDGLLGIVGNPIMARLIKKAGGQWDVRELARIFPKTLGVDMTSNASLMDKAAHPVRI